MIYYEISDIYGEHISIEDLKNKLDGFNYIKFYAFILHNRTENAKPHYHILIQVDLNNKKAKSRIEKDFKSLNPFVKNVRNCKAFARYLQHLDYVEKEKYFDFEVITNNTIQFNDLKKVELKTSKIEGILKQFYNYLLDTGVVLSFEEAFNWWLERGQANYFICHQKSICDFIKNLKDSETYYETIERRINYNDTDNCDSSYTIDNLV